MDKDALKKNRAPKAKWNDDPAKVEARMDYITEEFHKIIQEKTTDLYKRALINTANYSATPITGWPPCIVQTTHGKLQEIEDQADSHKFYPLQRCSSKPLVQELLWPLIVAFAAISGTYLVGVSHVGKTPLALSIAMALGRFYVRTMKNCKSHQPGYRRGFMFDVFRKRAGTTEEACILDDPKFVDAKGYDVPSAEDLMAFGDSGYSGHSNSRYTPSKFAKNPFRVFLSNHWEDKAEPNPGAHACHWDQFFAMVKPLVGRWDQSTQDAFFKRYNTPPLFSATATSLYDLQA